MAESSFLNPARAVRAAKIADASVVADFGAGSGFFTRAAARAVGPDGRVWAVEVNRELLPRIKSLSLAEGLSNVEVVHGDIEVVGGTKLPPGMADFVIVANVLFSAADRPALASEVRRVLKKGGRALIIDWSGSYGGLGPHPSHVVTEHDAKKLFADAELSYLEEVPAGEYHWGFVVRKKT